MSNEQSIRDELTLIARDVHLYDGGTNQALAGLDAQRIADAILASPVIRRIQAEALREAADSDDLVALGVAAESSDFDRGVDFGAVEIFDALRSRADRIERGETA